MQIFYNNADGSQISVQINEDLKPCPFCGNKVGLKRNPLFNNGHGYYNCYEYVVECDNPDCRCNVKMPKNNTVYYSDYEASNNAIKAWNRRQT